MKRHGVLFCLSAALLVAAVARAAEPGPAVEAVNKKVDAIEKRLSKGGDLPHIDTSYEYEDATEGVSPGFKFFFDSKSERLVACKIHVGHETWSKDFTYYFDEDGGLLKYLEVVSGREDNPPRAAIIYGKGGKSLWHNLDAPRLTPEKIKAIYKSLQEGAKPFEPY